MDLGNQKTFVFAEVVFEAKAISVTRENTIAYCRVGQLTETIGTAFSEEQENQSCRYV